MHWSLCAKQKESEPGNMMGFMLISFFFFFFLHRISDKMYLNVSEMQICWIWQKVRSEDDRGFQRFLDNVQYKSSGILRYERVFGQGFVSTGGIGMPY